MNGAPVSVDGRQWCREADAVAARLNLHHLFASFLGKITGTLVLLGVAELLLRTFGFSGIARSSITAAVIVCMALWSMWLVRGRFCGRKTGLIRLETVLGLHNGLSAAYECESLPWPKFRESVKAGFRLNLNSVLRPAVALLFFMACVWVPVRDLSSQFHSPASELPPDVVLVQEWLEKLKQEELIEPQKLQDLQQQVDAFKNKPPEDWYKQDNLEAADALKEATAQAMMNLSSGLDQANDSLDKVADNQQKKADDPSSQQSQKSDSGLEDELKKDAQSLGSGSLSVKQEVVKQVSGAEQASAANMTAEQMKALQDKLSKLSSDMKNQANKGNGNSKSGASKFGSEMAKAMGEGERQRQWMDGPKGSANKHKGENGGNGGRGGGEESAPLELEDRGQISTGNQQKVTGNDLTRSLPEEIVDVTAQAPKTDPTQVDGTTGGTATIRGNGGEAVWRGSYDPEEADVLRDYFK